MSVHAAGPKYVRLLTGLHLAPGMFSCNDFICLSVSVSVHAAGPQCVHLLIGLHLAPGMLFCNLYFCLCLYLYISLLGCGYALAPPYTCMCVCVRLYTFYCKQSCMSPCWAPFGCICLYLYRWLLLQACQTSIIILVTFMQWCIDKFEMARLCHYKML